MAQSYEAKAESLSRDAQDKVQQLKAKAEDAANKVAREGQRALSSAEQTAENAYNATTRFVRDFSLSASPPVSRSPSARSGRLRRPRAAASLSSIEFRIISSRSIALCAGSSKARI
jgi:hypothetical protein